MEQALPSTFPSMAWLLRLAGWRRLTVAFGLGALSMLAMPPFGLWLVMFATFPGLVLLLDSAASEPDRWSRVRAAAAIGWCFGFGYLLLGLYWIGAAFLVQADKFAILMPFAITLLPAYLATYFSAAAGTAVLIWRPGVERLLVLAVALTIGEWLRGHLFTGFPWNAIGYGLTINLALAQTASLIGVTGLTYWAVLLFSCPVLLLRAEPRRPLSWFAPVVAAALLVGAFGWGEWRLSSGAGPDDPSVRLRLVQPNIAEAEKFEPSSQRRIFDRMIDLSRRDANGRLDDLATTTLLVWPEEPLNFLMLDTPEALKEIGAMLGRRTTLLTGAFRAEPDPLSRQTPPRPRVFNSLAIINPGGRTVATYDKIHLVPWGEYLPFQFWLEAIGLQNLAGVADAPGTNPRRLEAPGVPALSPLICYEAVFPGEVVQPGTRPRWLLNVTNDAWFGEQTGPYQHFHQTRIRAIEEGLPLVRVAVTGISAIVDARGQVRQQLPLLAAGVIDGPLPAALTPTLYARYGDITMLLQLLIAMALLAIIRLADWNGQR